MMRCAVMNCPNSSQNNVGDVSFHCFPTDAETLHTWISFTGITNFIPNFSSKICSTHFEDEAFLLKPKKLKIKAIPTLQEQTNVTCLEDDMDLEAKETQISVRRSDPLSCILNPNTSINKVEVVREGLKENETASEPSSFPSLVMSHSNQIVNFVSSDRFLHPNFTAPNDTVVLNYNRNPVCSTSATCFVPMQINLPFNFLQMQRQGVQMVAQEKSSSLVVPTSHQPSGYSTSSKKLTMGPIKLVDMKKLLQTPPREDANSCSLEEVVPEFLPTVNTTSKIESYNSSTKQFKEETTANNTTFKVTISQVLDCLKVILPVKFDLSRLIPNEKVSTLVIKYLKLIDNADTRNIVNLYLKTIVDASKTKEKVFGDEIRHPYLKIKDIALQLALEKVLPSVFSMSDLTNSVLSCLCIVLNQDIFVDGFHILRRQIRKFTSEGRKFSEIINQESGNRGIIQESKIVNYDKSKVVQNKLENKVHTARASEGNLQLKTTKQNVLFSKKLVEKCQTVSATSKKIEKPLGSSNLLKNESKLAARLQKFKSKVLDRNISLNQKCTTGVRVCIKPPHSNYSRSGSNSLFESKVQKKKTVEIFKSFHEQKYQKTDEPDERSLEAKRSENMQAILSYLEKQQCSAKDVLSNFRLMFYLCRFLNINSRQTNIQKLKESLQFVSENKINKLNTKHIESKNKPKQEKYFIKINKKENQYKIQFQNKMDKKLKLKPVVELQNLIDFCEEDLLLMKDKKKLYKQNGCYNQQVPFCFQQNPSMQKYSSEYVNKHTSESYKWFRKIISKKVGRKVVFRLKFTKLEMGSSVFVRDFRNPSLGWLKGTVKKMNGPLRYLVQLESGDMLCCVAEQLRPIPGTATKISNTSRIPRTPRLVKPKKLFDL